MLETKDGMKAVGWSLNLALRLYQSPEVIVQFIEHNLQNSSVNANQESLVSLAVIPVVIDGQVYLRDFRIDLNDSAERSFLQNVLSTLRGFGENRPTDQEILRRQHFFDFIGSCH